MPADAPLQHESVLIPGPAGRLEALVEWPATARADHVAVVCHPHPLYGGALTNKVVYTLARAFNQLNLATVRFNFRGVGASAGSHDGGIGEIDDVLAVRQWAGQRWPGARVSLAGFSFGAAMVLGVVAKQAIADATPWLVTVAPPVGRLSVPAPRIASRAWLLVQGSDDEVVDAGAVIQWAQALEAPPSVARIAGAGHFFHGKLSELREAVISWATSPTRELAASRVE